MTCKNEYLRVLRDKFWGGSFPTDERVLQKRRAKQAKAREAELARPDKEFRRRAKKRGVPCNLTMEFFTETPKYCPQCDKLFRESGEGQYDDQRTLDRLVPGLGYIIGNVEWICRGCNRKKQDQSYAEMIEFGRRGLERNENAKKG